MKVLILKQLVPSTLHLNDPLLEIHNDLPPKNDQVQTKENSSRTERLTELIRQQQWDRLTREQKSRIEISHLRQS